MTPKKRQTLYHINELKKAFEQMEQEWPQGSLFFGTQVRHLEHLEVLIGLRKEQQK